MHRADNGKGGWANTVIEILPGDGDRGDYYVYVAPDDETLLTAVEAEGEGDDATFGRLLGIPACCRDVYSAHRSRWSVLQNDPAPWTARRTASLPPHHGWNNIAAQYFGYSLLSFAPCSLDCAAAEQQAHSAHAILREIAPNFAARFRQTHFSDIVYSEWYGVHRLEGSQWSESGILRYTSMSSTSGGPLATALQAGDGIRAKGQHWLEVLRGPTVLSVWEDDDGTDLAFFLCGGK